MKFLVALWSQTRRILPNIYIALSYAWGDTMNTLPITVEGQVIQIIRNLKNALLISSTTSALVWADALCIARCIFIYQQGIPERISTG